MSPRRTPVNTSLQLSESKYACRYTAKVACKKQLAGGNALKGKTCMYRHFGEIKKLIEFSKSSDINSVAFLQSSGSEFHILNPPVCKAV